MPKNSVSRVNSHFYQDDGVWKQAQDAISFPGCAKLYLHPPTQSAQHMPAPLTEAFDAGFRCAAGWAQRDDLFSDINSPTYKKDRTEHLCRIEAAHGIGTAPTQSAQPVNQVLLEACRLVLATFNVRGLSLPENVGDALVAAIAQAEANPQSAQQIPAGWKLVPIEPTVEMLDAADASDREYSLRNFGAGTHICQGGEDHWSAMLSASPQPPQQIPAPLTDEQIYGMYSEPSSDAEMLEFARAIEAAHGIASPQPPQPPQADVARDALDAKRYRWLEANAYVGIAPYPKPHEVWCLRLQNPRDCANFDAAIDAAMSAQKGGV